MGWRRQVARRLLDRNRSRELRRQNRLLDRLEREFRSRIASEIDRAIREMVEVYRFTGEVPPDADHLERLTEIYQSMAIASMVTFGSRIVEQGKSLGHRLETKDFAQTMTLLALRYISNETIRQRITSVSETTRNRIVSAVRRGYEEGEAVPTIADRILEQARQVSIIRAVTIARTETHSAANYGSQAAAKETGLPLSKEWISAEDSRTRATHDRANGQIVPMDSPFRVGGARLMFPGDPDGPPDETINCRCAVGYIVDD